MAKHAQLHRLLCEGPERQWERQRLRLATQVMY